MKAFPLKKRRKFDCRDTQKMKGGGNKWGGEKKFFFPQPKIPENCLLPKPAGKWMLIGEVFKL